MLVVLRGLRGGAFDIFGYTAERKQERQLIADYFATIDELLAKLDRDNVALAVEIAALPEQIRGYGHVKEKHYAKAKARWDELMHAWRNPQQNKAAA